MSKLWDDLKDNMKDWSVTAVEKAEEMSKIAVAKTEEMTRISKVKFDIHQLHREMNKVYENLGKLVFEHTKNEHMASFSGNKDFFNLVNKIEDLKMKIEMKRCLLCSSQASKYACSKKEMFFTCHAVNVFSMLHGFAWE